MCVWEPARASGDYHCCSHPIVQNSMASPRLALDSLGNVDYLGAWEEETGLEKKQIVSRRCEKDICKDMEVNSSHFCARDASQTKKWKP